MVDNRCTVPFDGLALVHLYRNTCQSCCKLPPAPIDNVNGVINSQLIELRKSIVNNERSPLCNACWDIEDVGGYTHRKKYSTHFNKKIDWDSIDIYSPFSEVEFSFSNKCQMMCVYCSSEISSMWEDYKIKKHEIVDVRKTYTDPQKIVDITSLKKIAFTGGEPMLVDEVYEFIMTLPFDKNREISIFTNLSYGPAIMKRLKDIIEKHPNIDIATSLDSVGENITRKYLNWELWIQNFDFIVGNLQTRIKDHPKTYVSLVSTVSILSYKDLPGIINFILKYRKDRLKNIMFHINLINLRERLSLASGVVEPGHNIKLEKEDLEFMSDREIKSITSYNNLLRKVKPNMELQEETQKFISEYLSINSPKY